jgi:hypothetical protein
MTCTLSAFTSPPAPQQIVHVAANGYMMEHWTFRLGEAGEPRQAIIPASVLARRKLLRIDFVIDDPKSPLELNLSDDRRKLGIGVQDLVLTSAI